MEMREVQKEEVVDIDKLTTEVKAKFPDTKLYHMVVPYIGDFFIRGQDQSDVKASTSDVDAYLEKKIADFGGTEAFDALPEADRTKHAREADMEAGEISNTITLKRCVVYPYDFSEQFDAGKIKSGIIPLLLDKIMEISGWTDVTIKEV